jgi:hypothetical protein
LTFTAFTCAVSADSAGRFDAFFGVDFGGFTFALLVFVVFDFAVFVVPRAVEPFDALGAFFVLMAIQVLLSVVDGMM